MQFLTSELRIFLNAFERLKQSSVGCANVQSTFEFAQKVGKKFLKISSFLFLQLVFCSLNQNFGYLRYFENNE